VARGAHAATHRHSFHARAGAGPHWSTHLTMA
jgi:hypothetical protein